MLSPKQMHPGRSKLLKFGSIVLGSYVTLSAGVTTLAYKVSGSLFTDTMKETVHASRQQMLKDFSGHLFSPDLAPRVTDTRFDQKLKYPGGTVHYDSWNYKGSQNSSAIILLHSHLAPSLYMVRYVNFLNRIALQADQKSPVLQPTYSLVLPGHYVDPALAETGKMDYWGTQVKDQLKALMQHIQKKHGIKKIFLVGHSLGASNIISALGRESFDAEILALVDSPFASVGTPIRNSMGWFTRAFAPTTGLWLKHLTPGEHLDPEDVVPQIQNKNPGAKIIYLASADPSGQSIDQTVGEGPAQLQRDTRVKNVLIDYPGYDGRTNHSGIINQEKLPEDRQHVLLEWLRQFGL